MSGLASSLDFWLLRTLAGTSVHDTSYVQNITHMYYNLPCYATD